jgi:hypothetical protein
MLACQFVGMIAGMIVERVTRQHEAAYRTSNPIPRAEGTNIVVVDEVVDEPTEQPSAAA